MSLFIQQLDKALRLQSSSSLDTSYPSPSFISCNYKSDYAPLASEEQGKLLGTNCLNNSTNSSPAHGGPIGILHTTSIQHGQENFSLAVHPTVPRVEGDLPKRSPDTSNRAADISSPLDLVSSSHNTHNLHDQGKFLVAAHLPVSQIRGDLPMRFPDTSNRVATSSANELLHKQMDKANLDAEFFDFGARLLYAERISLKGVSQEASTLFQEKCNQTAFNTMAGWNQDLQDPGLTGGSSLAVGTWDNKSAYLTNLFRYAQAHQVSPPFTLQFIFSSCLYYAALDDSTMRATYFNSIVLDLCAMNLILEKPSFTFVRQELSNRLMRMEATSAPQFTTPYFGLTPKSAAKIIYDPHLHYMLHLWERIAVRFHTAYYIRMEHMQVFNFQNMQCLRVRLWHDKMAKQRGRTLLLSCSCYSPIHNTSSSDSQSSSSEVNDDLLKRPCLVHAYLNSPEREHAFESRWCELAKILNMRVHAMHRMGALFFTLLNLSIPMSKRTKDRVSNSFLGWEENSHTRQKSYCIDLCQFSLQMFAKIPYTLLLRDMEISYWYKSTSSPDFYLRGKPKVFKNLPIEDKIRSLGSNRRKIN